MEIFVESFLKDVKRWHSSANDQTKNNDPLISVCLNGFRNAEQDFLKLTKQFNTNLNLCEAHDRQEPSVATLPIASPCQSSAMATENTAATYNDSTDDSSRVGAVESEGLSTQARARRDNLNQKERWLAESSDSQSSASESGEEYSLTRKKRKGKEAPKKKRKVGSQFDVFDVNDLAHANIVRTNESADDVDDDAPLSDIALRAKTEFNLLNTCIPSDLDEDRILIKNEPVVLSPKPPKYSRDVTIGEAIDTAIASNRMLGDGGEICPDDDDVTNHMSMDYTAIESFASLGGNMEFEGEFYGYDSEELQNGSMFEIGVKSEIMSQPQPMDKNCQIDLTPKDADAELLDNAAALNALNTCDKTMSALHPIDELGDTLLADEESTPTDVPPATLLSQPTAHTIPIDTNAGKATETTTEMTARPHDSEHSSLVGSLDNVFDMDDDLRSPLDTTGMEIGVSSSDESDLNISKAFAEPERRLVNGKQAQNSDGDSEDDNENEDIDSRNDREIEK